MKYFRTLKGWLISPIFYYGFAMALFLVVLKYIEYKVLVFDHFIEIYLGLGATLFMLLGAWFFSQLQKKKKFTSKKVQLSFIEGLSKREIDVLELMVKGCTNQQIADSLFLSIHTVKTHLANIFVKLDVKNRTQALLKAKELDIYTDN
jgi:NarL family two-component system response regulator LiaR